MATGTSTTTTRLDRSNGGIAVGVVDAHAVFTRRRWRLFRRQGIIRSSSSSSDRQGNSGLEQVRCRERRGGRLGDSPRVGAQRRGHFFRKRKIDRREKEREKVKKRFHNVFFFLFPLESNQKRNCVSLFLSFSAAPADEEICWPRSHVLLLGSVALLESATAADSWRLSRRRSGKASTRTRRSSKRRRQRRRRRRRRRRRPLLGRFSQRRLLLLIS